jgi:hypothetical protein
MAYHDAVAAYAATAIASESALTNATSGLLSVNGSAARVMADVSRFVFANALSKITPGVDISAELSQVNIELVILHFNAGFGPSQPQGDVRFFGAIATTCLAANAVLCVVIVLFIETIMYKTLGDIIMRCKLFLAIQFANQLKLPSCYD